MRPAHLPTVAQYLDDPGPDGRLWAWLSQMSPDVRQNCRVVDLRLHPEPGELLGEEWKPVAEHPELPVWLARRAW